MTRSAAERARVTLRLHDEGTALHRQTLRRRHPGATEAEIDALLKADRAERPLDHSST